MNKKLFLEFNLQRILLASRTSGTFAFAPTHKANASAKVKEPLFSQRIDNNNDINSWVNYERNGWVTITEIVNLFILGYECVSLSKAKRDLETNIPENIVLVFLPPYSPELNPAEKIWWFIKQDFVCRTYENLNKLSDHLCKVIRENINCNVVKSICSYIYLTLN